MPVPSYPRPQLLCADLEETLPEGFISMNAGRVNDSTPCAGEEKLSFPQILDLHTSLTTLIEYLLPSETYKRRPLRLHFSFDFIF